jgi:hypothetical protein
MKTIKLLFLSAVASTTLFVACQKNVKEITFPVSEDQNAQTANSSSYGRDEIPSSGQCNSSAYNIVLESHTLVGSDWEWIWSVQNSNPGNGNNGTIQDLSNWGMQFGSCFDIIMPFITGAAYSSDGINWTPFTPAYEVDPSQNCITTPVLKFDFGTTGSAKSYYKLILSQEFPVGNIYGYYKSGKVTGCCTFEFSGVSCGDIR